jgi:hypothetical protein
MAYLAGRARPVVQCACPPGLSQGTDGDGPGYCGSKTFSSGMEARRHQLSGLVLVVAGSAKANLLTATALVAFTDEAASATQRRELKPFSRQEGGPMGILDSWHRYGYRPR